MLFEKNMKDRIYVCHTYYHVYIAVVKELNLEPKQRGNATLVLSTMANDFESLDLRARESGLFEDVLFFDEQVDSSSKRVMKYHSDRGNIILNLLQRIVYTRLLGKLQEPHVPVDFTQYKDIYVFNDSDPIGYYLNYKKIYYHALEDGLDTLVYSDSARWSNRGHFELKCMMAKKGLIFIENGYSKYCLDMEINDDSRLKYKSSHYVCVNRQQLIDNVSKEDKLVLLSVFMEDVSGLLNQMQEAGKDKPAILILTEPLCALDVRKQIFEDIIAEYGQGATVYMKPHPRDILDYEKEFPQAIVLKGRFPMEVMNDIPGIEVDKVISVFTVVDSIHFAKEKIFLSDDFMDKYEAPELHRQNELI